jgi:Mg-chelatase subunit ChlD
MKLIPFLAALAAMLSMAIAQDAVSDALTREREEQTGTAITILFDNSGSMNQENKINQAKAAFRAWLQNVPSDYKFSLITFEDQGRLQVPLGEKTRDLVARRVAALVADTSTPICGALRIAREQIEKRRREVTPYERHVVLIFTDGEENVDPRGIDGVRAEITTLRRDMVEVVGVGFHGEGDYMNGVATRFALANDERELKQGLAKVDAEVGSVDDLVVTAEDLAALKNFQASPIQPVTAAAVPDTVPAPPPAAAQGNSGKSNFPLRVVVAVVVLWLLGSIFSKSKKRSS